MVSSFSFLEATKQVIEHTQSVGVQIHLPFDTLCAGHHQDALVQCLLEGGQELSLCRWVPSPIQLQHQRIEAFSLVDDVQQTLQGGEH